MLKDTGFGVEIEVVEIPEGKVLTIRNNLNKEEQWL